MRTQKTNWILFCLLLCALPLSSASQTAAADESPGIALSGSLVQEGDSTFLVVAISVQNVTKMTAARIDVAYDFHKLELVDTLDDTDIERPGRQNFLGANILSISDIKEAGINEYSVSKMWNNGQAPPGSAGSGLIGLLVFRILQGGTAEVRVLRENTVLLSAPDKPIPEWSNDFPLGSYVYDPLSD